MLRRNRISHVMILLGATLMLMVGCSTTEGVGKGVYRTGEGVVEGAVNVGEGTVEGAGHIAEGVGKDLSGEGGK